MNHSETVAIVVRAPQLIFKLDSGKAVPNLARRAEIQKKKSRPKARFF